MKSGSAWAPLRHPLFRLLWIASVVSNIGTWMQNAAAGWLMTDLDPSPLTVSLVQVAASLPMFLFALPAGALADIVDRRRLLIVVQIATSVIAALFAGLVSLNAVTPALLVAFTFLLGAGAAFTATTWQAVVPQLVPREDLAPAIAANSAGLNVSRAVGWGVSSPPPPASRRRSGSMLSVIWALSARCCDGARRR
jgi:MFS family permease